VVTDDSETLLTPKRLRPPESSPPRVFRPFSGGQFASFGTAAASPIEQAEPTSPPTLPAYAPGLGNSGNTCFLNAILKALAAQPQLTADCASELLGSAIFREALPREGALGALRDALRDVAQQRSPAVLWRQPERVLAALRAATGPGHFRHGAQHDVAETLTQLLQACAAEVARAHASGALPPRGVRLSLRRTCCPVRRAFTGVLDVRVMCESCGATVSQRELLRTVPLDLPAGQPGSVPTPLNVLMAAAFAPELHVERSCDGCSGLRATLHRSLQRMPQTLVLQLKRFRMLSASAGGPPLWVKSALRVSLPLRLNLAQYAASTAVLRRPPVHWPPPELLHDDSGRAATEPARDAADLAERLSDSEDEDAGGGSHRLTAVVRHHGLSIASGHYTCDSWDAAACSWVRHDDARVYRVSEAEVLMSLESQSSVYLAFYDLDEGKTAGEMN